MASPISLKKSKNSSIVKMDYHELLKKAKEELPRESASHDRFEIPKIRGHIQGNPEDESNTTRWFAETEWFLWCAGKRVCLEELGHGCNRND